MTRRISVPRSFLVALVVVVVGNVGIASASAITVSTTPSNYPAFSSSVSDYVVPNCPATGGVSVNVTTDPGQFASVNGQPSQTGTFTATANVTTGQEFTIVEGTSTTNITGTWYMRCLPSDFPGFTSSVTGTPQAQFYETATIKPGSSTGYAMFFDANGVPVWWYPTAGQPFFATNDGAGRVAWTYAGKGFPAVTLSGHVIGTIASPDGGMDLHELQGLPGGNVLVAVDEPKCCTDLSSWGPTFPTNATIADEVIEVIQPSTTGNKVLWSWDALAHINPVTETDPEWYSQTPTSNGEYDVFHFNSASYSNGYMLVSFRHLNAIYGISTSTGNIFMKISGHHDPQSYTVVNDPVFSGGGEFCGQHDARILSATTITLHDNGTGCNRAPRAVEYSLDTTAHTATLMTSVTDPRAPSALCCGSARLLPGGDWAVDWGFNPYFGEITSTGSPVYTVNWTDPGVFAYRATPVMPGTYTSAQFRGGMDAQYPNPALKARFSIR